jgi:hypothetical protein
MWGRKLLGTESAPYPMANHKRTIDDANSRFTSKSTFYVHCIRFPGPVLGIWHGDTLLKSNNDRRRWLSYCTVLDGKRPLE